MSDSRTRIWFSLFVLAIFGIGLASGMMIGRRMGPPLRDGAMPRFAERGGPPAARPGGAPPLVERLSRQLELTAEQRARVEQIFEHHRPRLEQLQRDALARVEQQRREMHAEIRGVLTADQQQTFDRWIERQSRGRGGSRRGRGSL